MTLGLTEVTSLVYFLVLWGLLAVGLFAVSVGIIELTSEVTETEQIHPRYRIIMTAIGGFAIAWYSLNEVSAVPSLLTSPTIPALFFPVSSAVLSVLLSIYAYDVFRHWARRSKSHTRGFG